MNHIHLMLGSALLASSLSTAIAADAATGPTNKADGSQAMPARNDLKPGNAPSIERMGKGAQRMHGEQGAASGATMKHGDKSMTSGAAGAGSHVRDGAAIDTNGDNLIQPEEMEAALKEVGPQAKSKP